MKHWQLPLTAAIVLAVATPAPKAAADEPLVAGPPMTVPDEGVGPAVDMQPGPDCAAPGRPIRRRLQARLHSRGLGCWATHETVGCGSCQSHRTFIFGSCRAFFGEPCLQAPPPPVPGFTYGPPRCSCP